MMDPIEKVTLQKLTAQMASHRWRDEEISELVAPQMGVISSYQSLLDSLERLRHLDLGEVPPAGPSLRAKQRS